MRVEPRSCRRLGEMLAERTRITPAQITEALQSQAQHERGRLIGEILVARGWISERDLLQTLSEQFGLPYLHLRPGSYDPLALAVIDKGTARRHGVLPLFTVRGVLFLATSDPQAIPKFDEIGGRTGLKVAPVLAESSEIRRLVEEAYAGVAAIDNYAGELEADFSLVEARSAEDLAAIDELAEGSPVVNLVNALIQRAVRDGASDIHVEPGRTTSRVRFRIDGLLYEVMTPRTEMHAAIASRLKVIANLDIAERRLPQDGRIQVVTQGRQVDLRFSSLPGIYGEKVVLRVLDKNRSILDLNKLGMTAENLANYQALLKNSNGLILVTGPTGSGKSTTLYAAINHLNSKEKNIVTIEDPVEYQLDIVNQNQVKESIGLGFATMLKHVLRQDPDIIMVGEIRDRETAEIAVQSALTGHLVISTLHTNDSIGAISRLLDMGIEPFLLSSALIGVIGQRLVRTVCPHCKTTYLPSVEVAAKLGQSGTEGLRLSRGRGCGECYDSGYKGRIGIHEILRVDGALQRLMHAKPGREDLENYVHQSGMKSLLSDGYQRVRRGLTTLEEISRAVNTGGEGLDGH